MDELTGAVGVFRAPSGYANGHTLDRLGRVVVCEQGNRRVTRLEHNGSVTVLADGHLGRRFNSPNDVVEHFDPDGTLLGKLHVSEVVSNLAFGGPKRNDLFLTATTSLYTVRTDATGAGYR